MFDDNANQIQSRSNQMFYKFSKKKKKKIKRILIVNYAIFNLISRIIQHNINI